ncbi:Acetylglutamate kinase [Jeotgalicoccus saudimassiliensis]|uniref:Acetylglutamate kinase n=1 Tax=Jeotgalicoccus saudimassiliensis TaxID=1461582 RepID=A0A078LUS4_9STAP|nr:acetylglutamate kinase [Jeotgalicoccus saudimassiliensis]CDZ98933.1 Acetylglutamate kinase [Jeotgalicoccus saudimassiliensis]
MNDTQRIDTLIEALPYINVFQNNIIVLKYGGNAMVNDSLKESVMQDVLLMKSVGIKPVIVHGGGPFINDMLSSLSIESEFKKGLRVTDDAVMEVAEMVLSGQVNKDIVKHYNKIGGSAVGISGKDGNLIKVKKKFIEETGENGEIETIDIGLVGEIETIDTTLLTLLINNDFVPVISPVGVDMNGDTYNINADYVAGEVAGAIGADKFILLTDTKGVYRDKDDETTLLSELTLAEVDAHIESGIISDGMIPKVECCSHAIKKGVKQAHIVDGRIKHSLLLELFFDAGIGTMIIPHEGGRVL